MATPKKAAGYRTKEGTSLKSKKENAHGRPRTCWMKGCSVKLTRKGQKWCADHKAAVRKAQLIRNNQAWYKRVQAGKASHRLVYNGKPTAYAASNPLLKKNAERRLQKEKTHVVEKTA